MVVVVVRVAINNNKGYSVAKVLYRGSVMRSLESLQYYSIIHVYVLLLFLFPRPRRAPPNRRTPGRSPFTG